MKFIEHGFTCGPASIRNALRCLGLRCSEKKIAQLCGTSSYRGTSGRKMIIGLQALGFKVNRINLRDRKKALQNLASALRRSSPVILCVDRDDHWITAIGQLGERVIIFDSGTDPFNLRENGVHVLSPRCLAKRWINNGGIFYGLAVLPKTKNRRLR